MARLSLYQSFARTVFTKASPWQGQAPLDIDIAITDGLHAGSLITLSKHSFVVGPSETGDVMLLDESAAGDSVTITAERSFLGPMISIKSSRDDVTIDDQPLKKNDATQTFRLPCTLILGDIPMRVTSNKDTASVIARPSVDILRIVGLSCICVLAFGFATSWGQPSQSSYDLSTTMPPDERAAPVRAAGSMTSRVAASLVDATLAEYDLGDYLAATPKSSQAIAIRGTLPENMRGNWYAAREQLNTVDREMLVLSEFDITPARPSLPAIASVRFGDNPGLIFADKSIAAIGDVVSDGWRLDSVDKAGFAISRFGVSLDIEY